MPLTVNASPRCSGKMLERKKRGEGGGRRPRRLCVGRGQRFVEGNGQRKSASRQGFCADDSTRSVETDSFHPVFLQRDRDVDRTPFTDGGFHRQKNTVHAGIHGECGHFDGKAVLVADHGGLTQRESSKLTTFRSRHEKITIRRGEDSVRRGG